MAFDHRDGAAATNPYAPVMGRTFVALDETNGISVIDAVRVETLSAWVARIIPAGDGWPSADELDTVAYIDAILRKAPELRPVLLSGIDAADSAARSTQGRAFAELGPTERDTILAALETTSAPEAFSVILELTYEAYYRAPSVQAVVKERTGFDVRNTVVGKPMKPFPTERLVEIASRPDRYRSVNA